MLKKPIGVLLLWLLITVAEVCADENPPLQLNINKRHFSLAGHLNFYSDTSAAETFKQANQAHYRPVAGFPGGGYSAAAHWYHFTLVRTQGAPHDWILALGEPFLDDVQVWLEQADGHFEHHQLGDHTPFCNTHYHHACMLCSLPYPKTSRYRFMCVYTLSAL